MCSNCEKCAPIMGNRNLWDTKYQDTADLAVIVAGDFCEQKVLPELYLPFYNDLEYLSFFRLCLLTGSYFDDIRGLSLNELNKTIVSNIRVKCPGIKVDAPEYRVALLAHIYPFAIWKEPRMVVEYSSLTEEEINSPDVLDILKKKLSFDVFEPFMARPHECIPLSVLIS